MKGVPGLYNIGKKPYTGSVQEPAGVGFLLLLAVITGTESSRASTFSKDSHQPGRLSVMITGGTLVQVKCPLDSSVANYYDL